MNPDPKIQQFLEDTSMASPEKYTILQAARDIVFQQHPAISERFIYGGIMFSLGKDFGGIFASKHHVSFEFSQGYLLNDPDKHLEGAGKFRRHLKLCQLKDVSTKNVAGFVSQAMELLDQQ
ncbi:MAG: DUF1801 domain-containing protein [Rhodobacteraceae bacterium]|nr:DUF1801 domain-containing protein [Paracoccaceae bacterium]